MKIRNSLLVLFVLGSAACNRSLSDKDYVAYVRDADNGFRVSQKFDPIVYTVGYIPNRQIAIQEHLTGVAATNRSKQLEGVLRFTLTLSAAKGNTDPMKMGISDINEYNQRLNYFLTEARNDIHLQVASKQFQPISYQFENNYGLTPDETIVVAFETSGAELQDGATLSFTDQVFRNGIINTHFSAKTFNQAKKM